MSTRAWSMVLAALSLAATACTEGARGLPTAPVPVVPLPSPAPLPTYTVAGVVVEATPSGNVAIAGVHVEDSERHVWTRTDTAGSYSLSGVARGPAWIFVFKQGYAPQTWRFTLNGDTRLDIVLARE